MVRGPCFRCDTGTLGNRADVRVCAGLRADLTILAKLACVLSRARALRRLTSVVGFS